MDGRYDGRTRPARRSRLLAALLLIATLLSACASAAAPAGTAAPTGATPASTAQVGLTPTPARPSATLAATADALIYKDLAVPVEERVRDLLGRMTLDEKIGQMTQVDHPAIEDSSKDVTTYFIGSILSGGGSEPGQNTPQGWADLYDRLQGMALQTRLGIPLIYGIDAVHGHSNLKGATIFPHNIGLGATRNPELAEQIGAITAREVAATGIDWNFSPCLCVARDERWGRTYESFGENPEIAVIMSSIIRGMQGARLSDPGSVLATAKHWLADGGTEGGDDQGDAVLSEEQLRAIHMPPYRAAIQHGVGSIMVSFSSFNGQKLHGHKYLINDVLKGELGFSGFIVSDWQAIDQLPGDYNSDVRDSINAGIDMIMVPYDYKTFIQTLRAEVEAGRVPMARIDDAVRRILTKKFELGLFERPLADRSDFTSIGSPEHRAVARDAVRQSMVLLKNEGGVLPLKKGARIFVAGKNADDIGNQSGGWSISWQGSSGDITPGTTILEGIKEVAGPDASVTYNRSGEGAFEEGTEASFDVAVVVVGERPYAEGEGDRPQGLELDGDDKATLKRVQQSGLPLVVVLVSGRPIVISEQLPEWDAFMAAWLPGSEGAGVADVLFGDYKPGGKLPMSWPRSNEQIPINIDDESYDPLFPYGFGLTYK